MSVIGFFRYNKFKKFTLQAWYYCALYRIMILTIPMKYLEKKFGVRGEVTSEEMNRESYIMAVKVSNVVNWVADKTPWKSKCLVRALTAQKILTQHHIATTLYLGVGKDEKDKMVAHAWIRYGTYYITGGEGKDYAIVATFTRK